ncbi:unnamed protein product, partial [Musa acuminata subsp. burmannicoides]
CYISLLLASHVSCSKKESSARRASPSPFPTLPLLFYAPSARSDRRLSFCKPRFTPPLRRDPLPPCVGFYRKPPKERNRPRSKRRMAPARPSPSRSRTSGIFFLRRIVTLFGWSALCALGEIFQIL